MRLYVNVNEIDVLKRAINREIKHTGEAVEYERLSNLLERIELCEKLQDNQRRSEQ